MDNNLRINFSQLREFSRILLDLNDDVRNSEIDIYDYEFLYDNVYTPGKPFSVNYKINLVYHSVNAAIRIYINKDEEVNATVYDLLKDEYINVKDNESEILNYLNLELEENL